MQEKCSMRRSTFSFSPPGSALGRQVGLSANELTDANVLLEKKLRRAATATHGAHVAASRRKVRPSHSCPHRRLGAHRPLPRADRASAPFPRRPSPAEKSHTPAAPPPKALPPEADGGADGSPAGAGSPVAILRRLATGAKSRRRSTVSFAVEEAAAPDGANGPDAPAPAHPSSALRRATTAPRPVSGRGASGATSPLPAAANVSGRRGVLAAAEAAERKRPSIDIGGRSSPAAASGQGLPAPAAFRRSITAPRRLSMPPPALEPPAAAAAEKPAETPAAARRLSVPPLALQHPAGPADRVADRQSHTSDGDPVPPRTKSGRYNPPSIQGVRSKRRRTPAATTAATAAAAAAAVAAPATPRGAGDELTLESHPVAAAARRPLLSPRGGGFEGSIRAAARALTAQPAAVEPLPLSPRLPPPEAAQLPGGARRHSSAASSPALAAAFLALVSTHQPPSSAAAAAAAEGAPPAPQAERPAPFEDVGGGKAAAAALAVAKAAPPPDEEEVEERERMTVSALLMAFLFVARAMPNEHVRPSIPSVSLSARQAAHGSPHPPSRACAAESPLPSTIRPPPRSWLTSSAPPPRTSSARPTRT